MTLAAIPDEVWNKLAAHAIYCRQKNVGVTDNVSAFFYKDIYEIWGKGKVAYTANMAEPQDSKWNDMIALWEEVALSYPGQTLRENLGDHSVGQALVQRDAGRDSLKMARMWERYNNRDVVDRFQFVVDQGGGMVLFNRMRRACQEYIIKRRARDVETSAIMGWKVFGEEGAVDRSDSCVVYLAAPWTDAQVTDAVENFIWPQVKDLVDDNFVPLGFHQMHHKPLWAMPLPDAGVERAVLRRSCDGSAGALMGNVLGTAFSLGGVHAASDAGRAASRAKAIAAQLVAQLYPGH